MIRKLKVKFVASMMAILIFIFAGLIGAINYSSHNIIEYQISSFLEAYADESIDYSFDDHRFNFIEFYTVRLDSNNQITEVVNNTDLPMEDEDLEAFAKNVLDTNEESGVLNGYQFYVGKGSTGKVIVFTKESTVMAYSSRLLKVSLWGSSIALLILFFISILLSNWMIKPVKDTFEKQKQFISDASHELKTPISVISANADVLENEIGHNKWLSYIKSESTRMNKLVNHLLTLARLDDAKHTYHFTEFNLGKTVLNVALPFESTAFEADIDFSLSIDDRIQYSGQKEEIMQLTAILIDNAIKHTDAGGTVKVTLKQLSGKRILEVYNTGQGIARKEKSKIFERFYRSDEARSRSLESYGLGLSIAKSIVRNHKGKIEVQSLEGEWAKFTVTL